jgi:hypothetical protein
MWMRINRSYAVISPVRSNRASVTGALKKDGHGFQHRFDPALLGSSHEPVGLIGQMEHMGQTIF